MVESYGGNIPARIWARFMKAALAGTQPHDFPVPLDEVEKVAGCGRGSEYYLKGTEPQLLCGNSIDAYESDAEPPQAAGLAEPTVPPAAATPIGPTALPTVPAAPTAIPTAAAPAASPDRR
jgi:membrane peptidoglycan carboxypeptidase